MRSRWQVRDDDHPAMAGRIQFPRDMIERLGMRDRVQLQEEADYIGVWPDEDSS